ncbi:MAG TPA: toll/interleukin-1 receptor domain-containing protein [Candidatus Cybelea sp.]
MPYRVFVSYAHNDDAKPIDGGGEGFVSALMRRVTHYFVVDGPPVPEFFRDLYDIRKSRAYKPIIDEGLETCDALVIVLSRNWIASTYCKRELETFRSFRSREGKSTFQQRLIVVSKQFVPEDDLPELLKDDAGFSFQESHKFYAEHAERRGWYDEYFAEGQREQSKEFNAATRELTADLRERTEERLSKGSSEKSQTPQNPAPASAGVPVRNERVVFLAAPASDMKDAYDRLVEELQGRGYRVVPDPGAKMPSDATATNFIQNTLRDAEVSIHLIGEKAGPAPEEQEPILPLQLRLAAERAAAAPEGQTFCRIIWAPRTLGANGAAGDGRDPLEVVKRFGAVDGDKIEGCELGNFVEFVVKHLVDHPPKRPDAEVRQYSALAANARVYVWAPKEDADYALEIADALDKGGTRPIPTIFDNRDDTSNAWHEKQLATCDAVLIPWAAAKPGWVFSNSDQLRDWHELGRDKPFLQRCVVTGPPNAADKTSFRRFPPRESIDVVLDLTQHEKPSPDDLNPLFPEADS